MTSPTKKKAVPKKAAARKKPAAKKATAGKAVAKKANGRKRTQSKATSRKAAARKTNGRKVSAKKGTARKAPARKTTATAAQMANARRRVVGPAKPLADLNTAVPRGLRSAASKEMWTERTLTGTSACEVVTAHTGDVTEALLAFVARSESIVGCVAWLSSAHIAEALGRVGDVTILVQKERDLKGTTQLGRALVNRYSNMGPGVILASMPAPLGTADGPERMGAVRCVGLAHAKSSRHTPRMHNKFLVRGHYEGDLWVPEAVWTGSFNFSGNAGYSAENAVEINDPTVAATYLATFARLGALSEPLDWTHRVMHPEWTQRPGN